MLGFLESGDREYTSSDKFAAGRAGSGYKSFELSLLLGNDLVQGFTKRLLGTNVELDGQSSHIYVCGWYSMSPLWKRNEPKVVNVREGVLSV